MRVLITGVTGFAGRHLASVCAQQGATVMGVGRRETTEADPPEELESYESVDLSGAEGAREAVWRTAPDRIFHLAAEASVADSWNEPARVIENNICATLNLLEAVHLRGEETRVLIAGSAEEYGEPERLPVTEDHPIRPRNPYAVSKASIDLAAAFYADAYGMHVVRTRAFNHAGPGQTDAYVVSSLARQIAEAEASADGPRRVEVVMGNRDVKRDFTDVRDVVRAYWITLEHAEPDVYNVCSGEATRITDILAGLASHATLDVEQRTDPSRVRERDVMEMRGSHAKLTEATGWRPEISLDQTLRDTFDWWRAKLASEVRT